MKNIFSPKHLIPLIRTYFMNYLPVYILQGVNTKVQVCIKSYVALHKLLFKEQNPVFPQRELIIAVFLLMQ